jgi:hypothetical protein
MARSDNEPSLSGFAIPRQERRHVNQRREPRLPDVCDSAQIRFRGEMIRVPVHNISSHGAKIETAVAPYIGEAIEISFDNCFVADSVVRWVRGGAVGLEFLGERPIRPEGGEPKTAGRRAGEVPTRRP